ncbi:MAG: sensor histidine kinase, partial [Actinobacteria bacterium]|nr:sensor histidine kinase [Actinomycetota bacterium]
IWADRTPDELVECERHEALLNVAFTGGAPWRLMCPYDVTALDPAVIQEAGRNHRFLFTNDRFRESAFYRDADEAAKPFDKPLPEPKGALRQMTFDVSGLDGVRLFAAAEATGFGLDAMRIDDLVLAVNEIATNSLRHGGGSGSLRTWRTGDTLVCEVRDHGRIEEPLVGRERPVPDQEGGYGLWLANQLCDLVQIRTFADGSVVRLHMSR